MEKEPVFSSTRTIATIVGAIASIVSFALPYYLDVPAELAQQVGVIIAGATTLYVASRTARNTPVKPEVQQEANPEPGRFQDL